MKDELINNIVCMLDSMDVDTDGIADRLYLLMQNLEIREIETALVLRDDAQNEQLIRRFLAAKMVKGLTKRTIQQYGRELTTILRKIGKPATKITSDDIRIYIAIRLTQDGISKVTANGEVRYLRTFFSWLDAEEIIPRNPMQKIERIKEDKVKKKAFTEMECEQLRNACRTPMETAIVELLLSTGCRVSELAQMRIDEIKEDKIVVHGKGGKDRTVFLNAKAQMAVFNYLKERGDNNSYVFPKGKKLDLLHGENKGDPYWYRHPEMIDEGHREKSSIGSTVRKIGKRAGVENTHPHRFRRTCATLALRRGMPIELVSKMLGHEQLTTTQIYLDLTENELEAAHRKYVV